MAKIDRDYSQSELMEYLLGRQAGVFIIFAIQTSDGEFVKREMFQTLMVPALIHFHKRSARLALVQNRLKGTNPARTVFLDNISWLEQDISIQRS